MNSSIKPISEDVLHAVADGRHHDPHSVLGAHLHQGAVTIRTLAPLAQAVQARVMLGGAEDLIDLHHEHEGIWVGQVPSAEMVDYRIRVTYDGHLSERDCPYRHAPTLGEVDLHLFGEGRHEELWKVLGAHVRTFPSGLGDVQGTSFSVWAPHAQSVRVTSEANLWDGRQHAMRSMGGTGVWELFIPGVKAGTAYKFEILTSHGQWVQRADPMARYAEVPPATASVVTDSSYAWDDAAWLEQRSAQQPTTSPMSVYEVHLGSWRPGLSYRELADQLVGYVRELGFTHVEFLPVAEHPFGGSWGYQVTGYYAPTSRFGNPDDFRFLVDALHQAGIGVIMDWVPAHFPKDEWALARFDGQALYEHPDPRMGDHPDWGTHVFNFGQPQVRNFLVANALYWFEEFHVDAIRVDAVASMLYLDYSREADQWVPNEHGGRENLAAVQFLQEMNATVYKRIPGALTIAEESTSWPGVTRPTNVDGLGFGMKWNMGWMNDSLEYMAEDPVNRQYHHNKITFSLVYAFSENFVLPISHDEVVHGKGALLAKMPGDRWQQLANVRAYLAFMWSHPGKQLLFMGCELGQDTEWAEARSLSWWLEDTPWHAAMQQLVKELNRIYRDVPALWQRDSDPGGFAWLDAHDAGSNLLSYLRYDDAGSPIVCLINFSPVPHHSYRLGLPSVGTWQEVLNTDAEIFGGSGVGNLGQFDAREESWQGMPACAEIVVPPLAALWIRPCAD